MAQPLKLQNFHLNFDLGLFGYRFYGFTHNISIPPLTLETIKTNKKHHQELAPIGSFCWSKKNPSRQSFFSARSTATPTNCLPPESWSSCWLKNHCRFFCLFKKVGWGRWFFMEGKRKNFQDLNWCPQLAKRIPIIDLYTSSNSQTQIQPPSWNFSGGFPKTGCQSIDGPVWIFCSWYMLI